jgi:hypothetical protein
MQNIKKATNKIKDKMHGQLETNVDRMLRFHLEEELATLTD